MSEGTGHSNVWLVWLVYLCLALIDLGERKIYGQGLFCRIFIMLFSLEGMLCI